MKKTDIAMLVLIAGVSVLISALVLKNVLGDPSEKTRNVKVTEDISDSFTEPSKDIFNKDAVNPTVQIVIGNDSAPANDDEDSNNESDSSQQNTSEADE